MMPVSVGVGDKVLLPEYGGTQVIIEDKVHFHFLSSLSGLFSKLKPLCDAKLYEKNNSDFYRLWVSKIQYPGQKSRDI